LAPSPARKRGGARDEESRKENAKQFFFKRMYIGALRDGQEKGRKLMLPARRDEEKQTPFLHEPLSKRTPFFLLGVE